jgi:hypothetical protein
MKFLLLLSSIIALLHVVIAATNTIKDSINALVKRFDMHELYTISDEKEITWFVDRDHIVDPIFFYNSLFSELLSSRTFTKSNQIITKYCMRKYLALSESDQNLLDSLYWTRCFDNVLENDNYVVLFELVINFGSKMIELLDDIWPSSMKPLTEMLLAYSKRHPFMHVIGRNQILNTFTSQLFCQLILLDAPESLYIEYLEYNADLFSASIDRVIEEYEMRNPTDIDGINKAIRILSNINSPSEIHALYLNHFNEQIKIISSSDSVTMTELDLKLHEYSFERKLRFMRIAGYHGKDLILSEILATLTVDEIVDLFYLMFMPTKTKKRRFRLGVKIYSMMSENMRIRLHRSSSYFTVAVKWSTLDSIEELPDDRLYSYKFVFKANSEQIADGFFEEMVYYHPWYSILAHSYYSLHLKFTSAESFADFISIDAHLIFSQNSETTLSISINTLKLIGAHTDLRNLLNQRNLKLKLSIQKLFDFISESSIETIPKIGNLISPKFLCIKFLSFAEESSHLAKIEKLSGKSIFEIIYQGLNALERPASQVEYFKIRSALVYVINSPDRFRLVVLPDSIKYFIIKEFPELAGEL